MARELLNTLYVTTQGAYLRVEGQTLKVESEGATLLRVPVHHLEAVVCFGRVNVSSPAMLQCADDGRDLVFMTRNGRFRAKVTGATKGNVLLRLAQYKASMNPEASTDIARNIVAAKVQNGRLVLMREARRAEAADKQNALRHAAQSMADTIKGLGKVSTLNGIRGDEGYAGSVYFSAFNHLIRVDDDTFTFGGRNRRPPRDPVNATLSFLYALLQTECRSACESVGLDPQVGFLHAVRPGRPSLALDLMEELRAFVADRLALTLINRRQLTDRHYEQTPGGGISLNEAGRKEILVAYQKRKSEEIQHPVLGHKTSIGLLPHLQARLLARHLRGDTEHYLPFISR